MRPAILLVALAPVVLAESHSRANTSPDLTLRAHAASIQDVPRDQLLPIPELEDSTTGQLNTRNILQARSEGSLGQTPWIGMAIGLTCTALAAVMLG
ncbi:hypothetical protein N7528_008860 [Penicillium herquei]|nr:hypothetical protein N7528_008860 [Penicillium herquei]